MVVLIWVVVQGSLGIVKIFLSTGQMSTDELIFCSAWINTYLDAIQQSNVFINTY